MSLGKYPCYAQLGRWRWGVGISRGGRPRDDPETGMGCGALSFPTAVQAFTLMSTGGWGEATESYMEGLGTQSPLYPARVLGIAVDSVGPLGSHVPSGEVTSSWQLTPPRSLGQSIDHVG